MQRRGTVRFGASIVVACVALAVTLFGASDVSAADGVVAAVVAAPASPADEPPSTDSPPITVTEFYPESANLSDCVGLVEQPGCGSGSRGGWGQTAVFVVLFAGLGVILWRVSSGIRANRVAIDGEGEQDSDRA